MLTRICISGDGQRLFVTDKMWHRIVAINVVDGSRVLIGGGGSDRNGSGTELGQFNNPHGICLSPNGDELFVVESGNRLYGNIPGRVQVLRAADGLPIRTFGGEHLINPRDICISQDGEVFVTDISFNGYYSIQVFDVNGVFKRTNKSFGKEFFFGLCMSGDKLFAASNEGVEVFNADGSFNWETNYTQTPCGVCIVNDQLFAMNERGIDVFRVSDRELVRRVEGYFGDVSGICVSPNGKEIFGTTGKVGDIIKVFQV
jgi:DNA-binding beta-propeller fold protein YncE